MDRIKFQGQNEIKCDKSVSFYFEQPAAAFFVHCSNDLIVFFALIVYSLILRASSSTSKDMRTKTVTDKNIGFKEEVSAPPFNEQSAAGFMRTEAEIN